MSEFTERLLTRQEAAAFLNVKESTLASWHSTQKYHIPLIKIGRCARYRLSDLLAFVERRTVNRVGRSQ